MSGVLTRLKLPARRWALLLFLGIAGPLLLPVAAYVAGGRVVGPYPGSRGLASYLGDIYAEALQGSVLALAIVLGPLLVALAWALRRQLLRPSSRTAGNE
jgi:hypothetical protein